MPCPVNLGRALAPPLSFDSPQGWTQDHGIYAFIFSVPLLVFLGWLATAVFWGKSAASPESPLFQH